jgi:replicative DNA helicase
MNPEDASSMTADPIAEQHVIGAVIHSAGAILDRLDLTDEDFSQLHHARLWRALAKYLETGKPLTSDLFNGYLKQHNATELLPALSHCITAGVIPQQAPHYAHLLRTITERRNLSALSVALQQLATSPGDFDRDELREQAEAQVSRFLTADTKAGSTVLLRDNAMHALEERWGKPDTNFLPTGWKNVDDYLNGGLRPGHLMIVGARPSVGKSFVATGIAKHAASLGNPVLFHSLEMSANDLTDRVMASVGRVNLTKLNGGTADSDDLDRLGDRIGDILEWPLHIDDRSSITLAGIAGRARDMKRKGRLSLLIVDYLQLITPADRKVNREQQVAAMSRGLKLLARELDVPVVALAQLNRGSATERPTMGHLRESGSIEADADEILLLHRSEEDKGSGLLEVIVEKNRHGSTGSVSMAFFPAFGDLADL